MSRSGGRTRPRTPGRSRGFLFATLPALTLVPLLLASATTDDRAGPASGWRVSGVIPPERLEWGGADPCTEEEIERLKSEYREKLQQLEDLENAEPLVDQLATVRGYIDMLNEAAGETKRDIEEFSEENAELLDLLKTEVRTQNRSTRRWARSVHQNEAWEQNTYETKREASVAGGLSVTTDALGDLEDFTGDLSSVLESFERGMRAETPAEQLEAFQNYFDTVTGLINSDEMKAAFPLLRVFEPWFEYFSKAIEFAAFMTGKIEESAENRERMLRDALAAGTDDFFSAWAIDYLPPRKSPYEILAEERERLEAELDDIAERLEDCGEEPPGGDGGRSTTGPALPVDYINARKLCFRETGVDGHTAASNERDLAFARRRVESLADGIRSYRGEVEYGLPVAIRTKEIELEIVRSNRRNRVMGDNVNNRDPVTVEAELEALRKTVEIYERRIEEMEEELASAYDEYRAKLIPVQTLKECLRRIMQQHAPNSMDQLPEQYRNCTYWNLRQETQTLVRQVRERPRTGGERPRTGGEEGEPETGEDDRRVSDARGGDPDAVGPTGGGGGGTAVAMTSVPSEVVQSVEPIAFEIAPRVLEEASFTTVDTATLINSATPDAIRTGSRDPTVQLVILDGPETFTVPSTGGTVLAPDRLVPGGAALSDPDLLLHVVSEGGLGADAMRMIGYNGRDLPVSFDGGSLVVEPVDVEEEVRERIEKEIRDLALGHPWSATLHAYCIEFLREPPTPGSVFRIANEELQQRFAPLGDVLRAGRELHARGLLDPDSDPTEYFHSIRQWAVWTFEEQLDRAGFERGFLEHVKRNFTETGQPWTEEIETMVRGLVPNRWNDVRKILDAARTPERTEGR